MSPDTPRESLHEWDAAYVLGALSPEDRRTFEEHLDGCTECRASIGELAGLPALLGRVPAPARAERSAANAETPTDARPALLGERGAAARTSTLRELARRVRRRRLARRWATTGAGVLAAAAIVTAVIVPTRLDAPPAPTTSVALDQPSTVGLTATVGLTSQHWGTAITMTCDYHTAPAGYSSSGGRFALYVTDASGTATRVASWSAAPGSTVRASGALDEPVSRLRLVEVRDADSGAVLLSSRVGTSSG